MNKVRPFPMDRVLEEIEWFGRNQISYVDGADANFLILERDEQIAEALIKAKEKWGFPQKFRVSFAKYSNDKIAERIFRVAKRLNMSGQLKSVTLALQSINDPTMIQIKRKNISMGNFAKLQERYMKEEIPTYSELILGLPEETYETFVDGIETLLNCGQHSGIFIYNCVLLPNAEMNQPEYKKRHGIQSVNMRAMLSHGTPNHEVPQEWQETVIATNTMPFHDWKKAYLFSKVVEIFHVQGLTQEMAITCHEKYGISYRDFYTSLMTWLECYSNSTVGGKNYAKVKEVLERALVGGSWDMVDPKIGDISWPPEEFAFAQICLELETFYNQLASFIYELPIPYDEGMFLLLEQRKVIQPPEPGKERDWAVENIWYGRKGAGAKLRQKKLQEA